jgi:hypothetical protein
MTLTSCILITVVYEKCIEPPDRDLMAYCLDDTKGMMTPAELQNNKFGAHTYGAPCFLYAVKHMLKVIDDVWSADR